MRRSTAMSERIGISLPIVVEGRYDKSTLLSIFDTTVITLGGFAVFNSKEKQLLLRRVAKDGIIVLTDSDGAGKQIRAFLNGIIPKEKIYNLYIPKVAGKEKRKSAPSKEGLLGVEGMGREELVRILTPFITRDGENVPTRKKGDEMITKVDFYLHKLTGAENSAAKRDCLALYFDLPTGMTPNALIEALNIVTDREGYERAVSECEAAE
jgi:ribonuclease M5